MRTPPTCFAICAGLITFFACISCAAFGHKVEEPTSRDGRILADYVKALNHCQDVGRDAGKYSAYEACTKEAGMK